MIEAVLTLAEARWILQAVDIEPGGLSPLADPLQAVPEVPEGSPAEAQVVQGLRKKGLLDDAGRPNPFVATALEWVASPDRVVALALFGPGGSEMAHLAQRGDACVECRRSTDALRLRFPIPAEEAADWLALRDGGGGHAE